MCHTAGSHRPWGTRASWHTPPCTDDLLSRAVGHDVNMVYVPKRSTLITLFHEDEIWGVADTPVVSELRSTTPATPFLT